MRFVLYLGSAVIGLAAFALWWYLSKLIYRLLGPDHGKYDIFGALGWGAVFSCVVGGFALYGLMKLMKLDQSDAAEKALYVAGTIMIVGAVVQFFYWTVIKII